jgi:hypothetical protein
MSLAEEGHSKSSSFKRNSTILSRKVVIQQGKKNVYNYVGKIYNTVNKIYVGGNNIVWVVKGSHIFKLKYDPFNGGEMYYNNAAVKFC